MADYKLRCSDCSKPGGPHNLLGLTPVYMEFQFSAPGPLCSDGKRRPAHTYRCPICGFTTAVQKDPGAERGTTLQGPTGLTQGDELKPQTWGADRLPDVQELGIQREEVVVQSQGELDAEELRRRVLGGDRAPMQIGAEDHFEVAISRLEQAGEAATAGNEGLRLTRLAESLGAFRHFARFAERDDHRLAHAQQMISQLEAMGVLAVVSQ